MIFRVFIYRIISKLKTFLSCLRPNRLKIIVKSNSYFKLVKKILKQKGYKKLKRANLLTWKNEFNGFWRITLSGIIERKKVIIKATEKKFKQVQNNANFCKIFEGKFSFLVPTRLIEDTNFSLLEVLYLKHSIPLSKINLLYKKMPDYILKQILNMLQVLGNNDLIHCDFQSNNILFDYKNEKLFLIDFDTVFSRNHNLGIKLSPYLPCRKNGEDTIYDDAFSAIVLLESNKSITSKDNPIYFEIKNMIGKLSVTRKETLNLNNK